MAKRFPPIITGKQTDNKKPKFDFGASTSDAFKITKTLEDEKKSLWDDDDDEYIMLASQAFEAEASKDFLNGSKFDTSYVKFGSEFASKPSSTQNVFKSPPKYPNIENQRFTELEDFLTDDCINLTDLRSGHSNINSGISNKSSSNTNSNILSNLSSSISAFRKDNKKLKDDYSDLSEKLQARDGEVAILRYELNQIKQQNDNLRLEKLQENDNMKKEIQEKIKELDKTIRSQQSELEFKNLEIINLKSKKLNETQKIVELDTSTIDMKREMDKMQSDFIQQMPLKIENEICIEINPDIFDDLEETTTASSGPSNITQPKNNQSVENLKTIQILLSQFQSSNHPSFLLKKIDTILMVVKSCVLDLQKYSNELDFNKFMDMYSNSNAEIDFLCKARKKNKERIENWNIYQKGKISKNEKAIISRRILAAVSIVCEYSSEVCYAISEKMILIENLDGFEVEENCLTILFDALKTIGCSLEVLDHFGLIAAAAFLLKSLSLHFKDDPKKHSILTEFFKQIVFSRPDAITLNILSKFLCNMCETNNGFSHQICELNQSNNLTTNEYYKIVKFSPNSCVLQVYAALLETAIPQSEQLTKNQLELLTVLTLNTGKFLRKCIVQIAPWIVTETDNNETNQTLCECYSRIASSYIIFFHLCLKHWTDNPKNIELITISGISRSGTILLNDIFNVHYRRTIIKIGGFPLKTRLQIIYDLLMENKNDFCFQKAHIKALQSLDLRKIIDDPLHSDYDSKSVPSQEITDIYNSIFDKFFEFNV